MGIETKDPRVFVVQQQQRWDGQKLVPKFDLNPARVFGELVYLLTPTAHAFNPDPIIKELQSKLANFTNKDFILLVGNPVLIGLVCVIAAWQTQGHLKVLQWSGKEQRYIMVECAVPLKSNHS